ncbi:unnamed protein product [Dibothriocephalus latus]|uniref:Uncharacterized protein n=1 Tax=Dibothriocephalus latus TaxID=60516 RepID=A0A3P7NP65_DIBLA|nr:unnamed protein product [Dibothriocephalus latus]
MATNFLSSVVDDSTDPSQPSSRRPSGSHQLILPPSESALTLLTEVASPSDDLTDSKKEPHEEAFSALDW